MPHVGFEPKIPASALPQTYALNRAAVGIGVAIITCLYAPHTQHVMSAAT
jgi:hypothetical protein